MLSYIKIVAHTHSAELQLEKDKNMALNMHICSHTPKLFLYTYTQRRATAGEGQEYGPENARRKCSQTARSTDGRGGGAG